ncbi:RHS repeat-associated core domain-containing protein [Streptomyces sp. NPDC021020]|uniref:RHS repeat-associated core domain-containing protein n=1 Tax=Streptomyces sp. NPDC021020 TaxID=3365109 RepID=UPI0037A79913
MRSAAVGYDANGNATSVTDYATPPHTTTYGYDAAGRVTRQVEPGDGTTPVTTTFGYDAAGNRTRLTDGRGNATWYTFNSLGLPESTIEPATATAPDPSDRTWTTAYDKAGQAVTATEPGGVKQTSAYDALGRVTSSTATGAGTTTGGHLFTYDLAGRMLTAATDAPATPDTFTYNDRGQLLTATGPSGTSSYTYDDAGQMTAGTSAAGTATYAYDNAGQLTGVAEPLTGAALSYHYDQDGNPATVGYGTGKDTRTFGYDDLDRLTSDTLTTPGGATVAATTYGYDRDDQLTTRATTGTAGAGTDTYTYDPSGRLSSWTRGTTTTDYGWDASGNLVKNGTTTADYDEQNHRTGDSTGATYTYTPRGTLTSVTGGDHPQTYTYDAFDRMTAAGATAYTYDALDRLTTRGGAHFTYAGASTQITTDGSSAYTYDPVGHLLALDQNGTGVLAYSNTHGDLTATFTPDAATPATSTAYDPLGTPTATTGTTPALGYQGAWTDPTTGQVDMNARWYDPTTGTFDSRDTYQLDPNPSVQANRYTYANADPLNGIDPSGHLQVPGETRAILWGATKLGLKGTASSTLAQIVTGTVVGGIIYADIAPFFASLGIQNPSEDEFQSQASVCYYAYYCVSNTCYYAYYCTTNTQHGACYFAACTSRGTSGSSAPAPESSGKPRRPREPAPKRVGPPPPPRDPCALRHCIVPSGPKGGPVIATPVDLTGTAGALAVSEDVSGLDNNFSLQQANDDLETSLLNVRNGSTTTDIFTGEDEEEGNGCTSGWVKYDGRDKANGGRAIGVEACLTQSLIGVPGGNPASEPAGYRWAKKFSDSLGAADSKLSVNRCHLLGKQLSGSGALYNLATCGRSTNADRQDRTDPGRPGNMDEFEDIVRAEVESGASVRYRVTPKYLGNRTVPYAFVMTAQNSYGTWQAEVVPNLIYSPSKGRWVNIGVESCSACASALPKPGVR